MSKIVKKIVKPNFFIVGAPKCGTTALSQYLRQHPNIYMSRPKEPRYFAEDFNNHRIITTLDQYLDLFTHVTSEHLAVGEASVCYLRSSVAMQNIYEFAPDAKIIVMVRNPVELVYSFHSQLVYKLNESEKDFEKAWKLQEIRRQGQKIPPTCKEPKLLQYSEVGQLGKQMERLFSIFPREQVHVIRFEDFSEHTQEVYQQVLDFLGVDHYQNIDFTRINTNKSNKSDWIALITEKQIKPLVNLAIQIKSILGIERLGIKNKLRSYNNKKHRRKPLNHRFKLELINEFKDDIYNLSQQINMDLSEWTN